MPRPRPYKSTPYKSPYRPSYQTASRPSRPDSRFAPRANTGEMKYFDTQRTDGAMADNSSWAGTELAPNQGTPNTLICPTVGAAINQRIGRKIFLYKLRIRGTVTLGGSAATNSIGDPVKVRLALVQDMQTNTTQAQGEQIFSTPLLGNALYTVNQFQSLDSLGRFKVWKDKMMVIQPGNSVNATASTSGLAAVARDFKMNFVFKKPIEISFNSVNGGTISDVVDNSFCMYGTVSPGAGANPVNVLYVARAYYKEL